MNVNSGLRLLVAGGDADPNLQALLEAARRRGQPASTLLVGKDSHPSLVWHIESGQCMINGETLECDAAFIRHDVFTALSDGQASSQYRALAWHTALTGWLASRPEIRIFNRRSLHFLTNKPLLLYLAQSVGLLIPQTVVTNDLAYLKQHAPEQSLVVKPINGGGFCQDFQDVVEQTATKDGRAAAPAIVQGRLIPPEVRVYAVGDRYFSFTVTSERLDYRSDENCRVEYKEEVSDRLTSKIGDLLDLLGLDFAAIDFKTSPESSQLMFLEVNTAPMFAAFDSASGGRLCDAMIAALTDR